MNAKLKAKRRKYEDITLLIVCGLMFVAALVLGAMLK